MTQEEFIKVLEENKYSYEIEGDKVVVTHEGHVDLGWLTSLPPGVEFNSGRDVDLKKLVDLPPGVVFNNVMNVTMQFLTSLPPDVEFNNGGNVTLSSLTSLHPSVKFNNLGTSYFGSLVSIPPGVEFRNGTVYFKGRSKYNTSFYRWNGNIEGIDSTMLLNLMIKQGIFER
jgi:hypothetical protein